MLLFCSRKKFQEAIQASYKTVKKDINKIVDVSYEAKKPFDVVKESTKDIFWKKINAFGVFLPLWQLNKKFNELKYDYEGTNKKTQLYNSGIYFAKKQILYIEYRLTGKDKYLDLTKLEA